MRTGTVEYSTYKRDIEFASLIFLSFFINVQIVLFISHWAKCVTAKIILITIKEIMIDMNLIT